MQSQKRDMNILHVVPGLTEPCNGIAGAAKDIANSQAADLIDAAAFAAGQGDPTRYDEIWVHSNWLPIVWRSCFRVLAAQRTRGVKLVRMPHANLDPIRYNYHGLKKRLVAPVERHLYRHTERTIVTCEAERQWCQGWGVTSNFELFDLKRFYTFDLEGAKARLDAIHGRPPLTQLKVLYLGRIHPLKGVLRLEEAVASLNYFCMTRGPTHDHGCIELRLESSLVGPALEAAWEWCDVLCLPTLSENFGRVIAEALTRGIPVITTDGAPAWEALNHPALIYLNGYRAATPAMQVEILKQALSEIV